MTREEEIKLNARWRADQYDHPAKWSDTYYGFISGAKWADEHPHWISVEDELPPIGGIVLIPIPLGGILSVLPLSITGESDFECLSGMTHWMPLPQPPKGGEK